MHADPDFEERHVLSQICWMHRATGTDGPNTPLDPAVCLRLEQKGLILCNSAGQWHPTPAGRFAVASGAGQRR